MAIVLGWRFNITCKEASLLISNPPTKDIAILKANSLNENLLEPQKIQLLQDQIRTFTKSASLHAGILDGTAKTRSDIVFPEPLRCILWLHRWAIADRITYNNFKLLLRSDITFDKEQRTSIDFYNPTWIRQNIINNVVKTVKVLVDNQRVEHQKKYISFQKMSSRLQAALMHYLTTEIVKAILKYGPDPVAEPNEDDAATIKTLDDIAGKLRLNVTALTESSTKKVFLPTTFTELILVSIPNFIETVLKSFGGDMRLYDYILQDHPDQQEKKKTAWLPGTNWTNFKVLIPLESPITDNIAPPSTGPRRPPRQGGVRLPPCSIDDFFQLVLTGAISVNRLFQESTKKSPNKTATVTEEKTTPGRVDKKLAKEKAAAIKAVLATVDNAPVRNVLKTQIDELCEIFKI